MKKLFLIGFCSVAFLAACSKNEKPSEAAVENEAKQTEIGMMEHLKNVNQIICAAMIADTPEKTESECVEQLNTLSEMDPQNREMMVLKENAEKCAEHLRGVQGSDVILQSTVGPCALSALQGS